VLSRELSLPVINTASAGDTTAEALAAISNAVWIKIPRLVIVLLGGKIFCARCVPGDAKKSRRNRPAQAQGAMVAIAGVKLGLFTDEYGSIFEETAQQFGALYVAQVLKGILTDSGLRSDPIHPNGAGYRMIAERIAAKIKPLLREGDRLRGSSGPE
jgi:acyl-CoA thioesterase I